MNFCKYRAKGCLLTLILVIIVGNSMMFATAQAQQTATLTSQPAKCISLKHGLVCYQQLQMHWQTEVVGDYCIVNTNTNLPIKCWLQQRTGEMQFEFAQTDSLEFALQQRGTTDNLAVTRIEVKWVYKAKRNERFRWRLF